MFSRRWCLYWGLRGKTIECTVTVIRPDKVQRQIRTLSPEDMERVVNAARLVLGLDG
jgi:hypothetical protein